MDNEDKWTPVSSDHKFDPEKYVYKLPDPEQYLSFAEQQQLMKNDLERFAKQDKAAGIPYRDEEEIAATLKRRFP